MGKNSLVKSTTKGKKKAAKKSKAAPKVKAASKPKAAPEPQPVPEPKKKVVSVNELLQKKFDVWKPEKIYTVTADVKDITAPPFISGSEDEQKRIRDLLLKKFDLAEIKAAADKAAADKAAADKAAADKAAAEKAAADKAAADKAAADKAAADKAAADKAAADKAAEPKVSVSYEPPDSGDTLPADPMEKGMKYLAAAVVLLIALVVGSSMINNGKYYIRSTDGALEIFQGRFAPMGEEILISLPGVQKPEKTKAIYSKTDVYPIIFNYYVEKADTLLKVPGLPDFGGIKQYLNKAMLYKTTPDSAEAVFSRLNNIDLMILVYKADVAASKPTLADLKEAKGFLSEAARLDVDDAKLDLINEKMDAVDKKIESLKAEQKGATLPALTPAPPAKTEAPLPSPHE